MPAKSKQQQRAAGAALAAKRKKRAAKSLTGAAKRMYENMNEAQLAEFASKEARTKSSNNTKK